jgi:hypothetical protein
MRPHASRFVGPLSTALLLMACDSRQPVEPPTPPLEVRLAKTGLQVAAPTNVTATAVSETRVDMSWQDNSSNETSFEVRRSTGGGSAIVATTAANVVAFSDRGLASGTTYCYDVRAVRVVGANAIYSAFSNSACATTLIPPPPPPPPPTAASNTQARPSEWRANAVVVTWSADNTATTFRIDRSTDAGVSWPAVATVNSVTRQLVNSSVPSEQALCYRVVAMNAAGEAPPSNVSCTAYPAAPTLTASLVDSLTLQLNWTDNSGVEDGYVVKLYASGPDFTGEVDVAVLPPNATAHRVDLTGWCNPPGRSSVFVVVAMKDGGVGGTSNAVANNHSCPWEPARVTAPRLGPDVVGRSVPSSGRR